MSSVSSTPILHQVKEMKKTNDDIIQDAIFWNQLRSVSSRTSSSSSSSSHTEKSAIKTTSVVDDPHEILGKKRRKKKLRMSHIKKNEQDGYDDDDDDDEFEVQQPEKEPDIIMNKRKTPPKLPPRTRPKLPQLPSANSSFSSTSSQHRKTPPKLPPRKPKRDQQHIACLSPMSSLGESAMKTLIFESQRSDSTKSAYQDDDLEEDDDHNNSFTKPKQKKTMSKMITWISKKLNAAQLKAISILAKTTSNSSQKLLLEVEQPVNVCEEQKSVSSDESQKQIKNEEDDNDDAYYKHEETYQEMADLLMQMFLEDMDLEEDDDEGESTELNYSHPSSPKLSSPSYQEQKRLSRLDLSQKSILVNRLGYDSSKILLVSPEGMLREEILLNSTKRKNHDRRSIRSIKIFQATTTTSSSTDLVVTKKRNARLRFFPSSSISTNATKKLSRLFNS